MILSLTICYDSSFSIEKSIPCDSITVSKRSGSKFRKYSSGLFKCSYSLGKDDFCDAVNQSRATVKTCGL